MRNHSLKAEAENCRRQAADFAGKPEATFLLRLAHSFDQLASVRAPAHAVAPE